jgi:hypothetical protein
MITTAGVINAVILLALSIIHIYWAVGGKWGFNHALPTNVEGKRILNPRKIECIIVAGGLFTFAFYYVIRVGVISVSLPEWLNNYGGWIISAIFALRAFGDFKYVGFTKRIKNTDFAKRDTLYFSPLCVFLALTGIIIEIMK